MASGIRVEGEPSDRKKCLWRINTWWWNIEELSKEVDLVEVPSCPGYQDFEAIISREKAQALAARFRGRAGNFEETAKRLDAALARPECVHVIVCVFEWEMAPPSDWIPGVTDRAMEEARRRWEALRPPPANQRWRAPHPLVIRKVITDDSIFTEISYHLTDSDDGPHYEFFKDCDTESLSFANPRQPEQDHNLLVCFSGPWMDDWYEAMITADILLSGYAEPPITFNKVPTT
jgi:hypothetical protein